MTIADILFLSFMAPLLATLGFVWGLQIATMIFGPIRITVNKNIVEADK